MMCLARTTLLLKLLERARAESKTLLILQLFMNTRSYMQRMPKKLKPEEIQLAPGLIDLLILMVVSTVPSSFESGETLTDEKTARIFTTQFLHPMALTSIRSDLMGPMVVGAGTKTPP